MNLIFMHDVEGELVAVNPEYVTFVETDIYEGKHVTMIYFTNYKFAVTESFETVVNALNGWRKKA